MSYLPYCPRFVKGSIDWSASWPMRKPTPDREDIGGSETAGGGVPASYSVREDYLLSVPLRFFEAEWPDVERLIDAMQTHGSTTRFYRDRNINDYQTCYIDSPARGQRWNVRRVDDMLGGKGMELMLVLRSASGSWDLRWFDFPEAA